MTLFEPNAFYRILWQIVVPLAAPAIATLAAFAFVALERLSLAVPAINSEEKWTVQLALANYVGQWDINWPRLLSMSVLSVIPMLLVFLALQRFFMSGLLAGAVKE